MELSELKKLKAFEMADMLVVEIYKATKDYPAEELQGLAFQLRHDVVYVPILIMQFVSQSDDMPLGVMLHEALRFLMQIAYYLELSVKLGYLKKEQYKHLEVVRLSTVAAINQMTNPVQ